MSDSSPERIKAAAVIWEDGEQVEWLLPPARHDHVLAAMISKGHPTPPVGEQGFITSLDRFVGRKEAMVIARREGQLLGTPTIEHTLFSEDLW